MTKENTKELIVIEDLNAKEVFAETGVPALLEKVKTFYVPKLDATTEEGREERRSMAYAIAKLKTAVDGMGKDHVGELKKVTTKIDERRRTFRASMEEYQAEVRKPLTEYEEKESKRIGDHNAGMNTMRELMSYDYEPDSEDIEGRIAQVKELSERDYEEFSDQAKTVGDNTIGRLSEKLAHTIKAEETARELAEAQRIIRENEEAQREADRQKEADDRAAEKVQADLDSANARAEAAEAKVVEQPKVETQEKTAVFVGNPQKLPPENTDKEHKAKVNRGIMQALIDSCMLSESAAKSVTTEIAKGNIENVSINYEGVK